MEPSLMQGMKNLYGGKSWIFFFLIIEEAEQMKPKQFTFGKILQAYASRDGLK